MPAPATPADASTVILTRATDEGIECFMVRRQRGSSFAPDVYVFPGGKVDPQDYEAPPRLVRGDEGLEPSDRALRVAGLRELFEEASVLLTAGLPATRVLHHHRLATYRRAVHHGEMTLWELAATERIVFDLTSLSPFARWITPITFPRRFDARFFIAPLPEGQRATHDERETTEGLWVRPDVALEQYQQGTFPLVFATESQLVRLSQYRSIEAVLQAVTAEDLQPVMPVEVRDATGVRYIIPGRISNETLP